MKPILLQAAMESELGLLKESFGTLTEVKLGTFSFYKGTYQGYPVVLSLTGIGTAFAAAATALAITEFDPVFVLNQGMAGAHATKHHPLDIILGQSAVAINSFEKPLAKEGIHYQFWVETEFYSGRKVVEGDKNLLSLFDEADYTAGNKSRGILGSGNVWNREWEYIHWLHAQFGSSSEDMESLAVYRIAHSFQVPVLGLRVIANNELNEEPYQTKCAELLQRFIVENMGKVVEYAEKLQGGNSV